ncbi:MAG: polysaccharide deacetylase family protein [Microbacteriaceae bacterium]|jgi:peptidoglycan/xylan/chitin deacetylase (PgdA/CDA1 family)|nr:polysaccharide deacetylase family protein [Microbacteriaceae bacterium]
MINLCFHGVGVCAIEREPGEASYWVTRELFLQVLDAVAGRGDVRLSFDDGNRSDIETALPALVERGLRADFFALAGRLDDPASLGPAELRELRAAGMNLGSHGWDHVPWRGLDAREREREFVEARIALSEASEGVIDTAAFPLGRYDRAALRGLKAAGYRTVFTSDRFRARPGAWLQARYSITAGDTIASVRQILAHAGVAEARARMVSVVKQLR